MYMSYSFPKKIISRLNFLDVILCFIKWNVYLPDWKKEREIEKEKDRERKRESKRKREREREKETEKQKESTSEKYIDDDCFYYYKK